MFKYVRGGTTQIVIDIEESIRKSKSFNTWIKGDEIAAQDAAQDKSLYQFLKKITKQGPGLTDMYQAQLL